MVKGDTICLNKGWDWPGAFPFYNYLTMQEAQQSWLETQSFAQLQWRPVSAAPTRSLLSPNSVWTLATVSGWSLPHLYNRILLLNHILERQCPHFHPSRQASVVQECVGAHSRNGSNHTMHGLFTIFTWGKLKPQHLRKMRIINSLTWGIFFGVFKNFLFSLTVGEPPNTMLTSKQILNNICSQSQSSFKS